MLMNPFPKIEDLREPAVLNATMTSLGYVNSAEISEADYDLIIAVFEERKDNEDGGDDLTCNSCGDPYSEGGDGYDGECPNCADITLILEALEVGDAIVILQDDRWPDQIAGTFEIKELNDQLSGGNVWTLSDSSWLLHETLSDMRRGHALEIIKQEDLEFAHAN